MSLDLKLINGFNKRLILIFVIAPLFGFVLNTYVHIDFSRFMQLISYFGVFLLLIFKPSNKPIKIPKYIIFYFLFILYTFFSTFFLLERKFKIDYLFSNSLIGALNFMIIIENTNFDDKFYYLSIRLSKIIIVLAVLVILIQQVFNPYFFVAPSEIEAWKGETSYDIRLPSIYTWASHFAKGFGFVPVFLIIIEDMVIKKKKIFLWILFGVIYPFLVKDRWVMLNTVLVFVILIMHKRNKVGQFFKLIIIVPILVLSSFFILETVGVDAKKIVEQRILESDKGSLDQKSASTRLLAFSVFSKLFWDNPILGVGSIKYGMGGTGKQDYKLRSQLGGSSQLHVGYLSLLYMYGIIGALFFLFFLFFLLKRQYLIAKKTLLWAPFLGILGFAIANLTLVTFSFFEMGLIYALALNKYYVDKFTLFEFNNKINIGTV